MATINRAARMAASTATRPRWRAIVAGVILGTLFAAAAAVAGHTPAAHTHHLWYNGMATEPEGDGHQGHPFLTSTDGTHRQGSASYFVCIGWHGPQAEYIHSHVHIDPGIWYRELEAHIGSQQTGMGHHDHFPCLGGG
jgi:hypothetical protein